MQMITSKYWCKRCLSLLLTFALIAGMLQFAVMPAAAEDEVEDGPVGPAASITEFYSVLATQIVSELPANILVKYIGENLSGKTVVVDMPELGVQVNGFAGTGTSGYALIQLQNAPNVDSAHDYTIRASIDGVFASETTIKVVPYVRGIWNLELADLNGYAALNFAADIKDSGYNVKLNDTPVTVTKSGNTLRTNAIYADLKQGDSFTVTSVQYPMLFPSYEFDFKTVVPARDSAECDIIRVMNPANAVLSGQSITASVEYYIASLLIDLEVSPGASWTLYSDENYESAVTNSTMTLGGMGTTTTAYIRVTAADGVTTKDYTIDVTRATGGGGGGGGGGSGVVPVVIEDSETPLNPLAIVSYNGSPITATVDPDTGILTLNFTAEDAVEYLKDSKDLNVNIGGFESATFTVDIGLLQVDSDNYGMLTITTNFGTLYIFGTVLKELRGVYGDVLTITVSMGSFKLEITVEGKEIVAYSNPVNPMRISLPYALDGSQQGGAVVAVKKDGGSAICPISAYKNGAVLLPIGAAGTYDTIYNEKSFNDVADHWATSYISSVTARELFSGIGGGLFDPDGSMTRAMFATVLARLDGANLAGYGAGQFSDVPAGEWYTAAIAWAADNNIVSGVGDGLFDPDASISREEMAVMLNNYIAYKGYNLTAASGRITFNDETAISSWAAAAVANMQAAGIISGKENQMFDPQNTAVRAEVAAIFTRLIEALV